MTQNSVQHRERIFVKGYGFLSFAKNIGKNITKNLSGKYSQKLDQQQMHSKLVQKEWFKNRRINWWFHW